MDSGGARLAETIGSRCVRYVDLLTTRDRDREREREREREEGSGENAAISS